MGTTARSTTFAALVAAGCLTAAPAHAATVDQESVLDRDRLLSLVNSSIATCGETVTALGMAETLCPDGKKPVAEEQPPGHTPPAGCAEARGCSSPAPVLARTVAVPGQNPQRLGSPRSEEPGESAQPARPERPAAEEKEGEEERASRGTGGNEKGARRDAAIAEPRKSAPPPPELVPELAPERAEESDPKPAGESAETLSTATYTVPTNGVEDAPLLTFAVATLLMGGLAIYSGYGLGRRDQPNLF